METNKFRKEFCEEKGLTSINPENTLINDYVVFLENRLEQLSTSKTI